MSGLRGNRGKIVFGSSGVVARVTQWSVEESGDTIETTAMDSAAADGPIAKTFIAGNTEWQVTVSCNVDRSDTDGQAAMRAGVAAALKLYPESDGSGKKYWAGDTIVTRMQETGEVNGKITYSGSLKGTGALALQTA
jgi:predicted secreted protein